MEEVGVCFLGAGRRLLLTLQEMRGDLMFERRSSWWGLLELLDRHLPLRKLKLGSLRKLLALFKFCLLEKMVLIKLLLRELLLCQPLFIQLLVGDVLLGGLLLQKLPLLFLPPHNDLVGVCTVIVSRIWSKCLSSSLSARGGRIKTLQIYASVILMLQ